MKTLKRCLMASAVLVSSAGYAAAEDLTLCWAAWDPANALVELSKDFEEQSGHSMSFEFVPWPNFADRMLNELNSGGKLCDLLIGDSQWIGGGAENGHYVKLNDFFDAEGISMDDFAPATVYAYSTWPKGTPNYYALPAMGDANGWFYRKDWFARPEIQEAFKAEYGRDLTEPKTQMELMEIAKFFQGREIDGQTVYGASIFTERGSEGITMGVTSAHSILGVSNTKQSPAPTRWKARSTRLKQSMLWSSTRNSTSAARRPATPMPTWSNRSTRSNRARWRWP
jgi:multiple sugar transport system substrate-binding protein